MDPKKARKVKFNFDLLKDTDLENGDRLSIKCKCGHKIEVTQFLEAQDKKTGKKIANFFKENPCLIAWDNPHAVRLYKQFIENYL